MGLDIYHQKATLERPDTISFYHTEQIIREDTFEGFGVPFEHFERYIQQIECNIIYHTLLVTEKEKHEFPSYRQSFLNDYQVIYNVSKVDAASILLEYEQRKGLQSLLKHTWENDDYRCIEYYRMEFRRAFYTVEAGYQRKGVNQHFWDRFCSNLDITRFALKADFEYAYQCVDKYWKDDTDEIVIQRKKDFKREFLDNYEFGASYMEVSY